MSTPAGYGHRTLIVAESGEALKFQENGARPTIAFTDDYIQVGCHKISRAAWELLSKRYESFIGKKREEIMQEGDY